jgi:sulfur relay (sulfurtransferase) complex TusBCD TusD component (DsrE family)
MAAPAKTRWDLLITLTAAPFGSDTTTTALRLLEAVLRRGARAQVWACGFATTLTLRALEKGKPPDLLDLRASHPAPAALIGSLLSAYPETFAWQVCRFCADDRGALDHVDGVDVRSFSRFAGLLGSSGTTVYLGGA